MTPAQLGGLAGLIIAAGLVLLFHALRTAPPSLANAIAQFDAAPKPAPISQPVSAGGAGQWLPLPVLALLTDRLGVADADLNILQRSRAQLAARKVTLAGAGLLLPNMLTALGLAAGAPGAALIFPAGLGLAAGAALWLTPSLDLKTEATEQRRVFRVNLESFLTLAAGEQLSNGSPAQALDQASSVSGSYPFLRMRQAIRRSVHSGAPPWDELRGLSDELAVPELRSLADLAERSSTGSAVYKSYLAEAMDLRSAELNDMRTQANTLSERMSRPLTLLVAAVTLFTILPFLIKISSGG